jgi:hypothetical protein
MADNQWHHVVAQRDEFGNIQLYADGKLMATRNAAPLALSAAHIVIGQNARDNSWATDGLIDEVKIYKNTTLTADQIKANWQKYAGQSNALLGYWKADGNTVDTSGQNTDATIVGNVTYSPGITGDAFQFDGGLSYVKLSPSAGNFAYTDFTAGLWVNTTLPNNSAHLISKRDSGGHGSYWSMYMTDGYVGFEIDSDSNGTNYASLKSATRVNDGQWHQVSLVRSGQSIAIYQVGIIYSTPSHWNLAFQGRKLPEQQPPIPASSTTSRSTTVHYLLRRSPPIIGPRLPWPGQALRPRLPLR